jgi:hypothetical protein
MQNNFSLHSNLFILITKFPPFHILTLQYLSPPPFSSLYCFPLFNFFPLHYFTLFFFDPSLFFPHLFRFPPLSFPPLFLFSLFIFFPSSLYIFSPLIPFSSFSFPYFSVSLSLSSSFIVFKGTIAPD